VADDEQQRRVWALLDSPTPPAGPLGDTTDYEQIVIAWAKRQGLDMDQLLFRLERSDAPRAQQLAQDLSADPDVQMVFGAALVHTLSGGDEAPPRAEESNAA
jgi:hypothetical protein